MQKMAKTEDNAIDDILTKWKNEQLSIASRVIVHPDPTLTASEASSDDCPPRNAAYNFLPFMKNDDDGDLKDDKLNLIYGGVDISFPPPSSDSNEAIAVYALHQNGKIIHQNKLLFKLDLPYIPSYLAMRELGPIQKLIKSTEDGQAYHKQEQNVGSELAKECMASTSKASTPSADVILVDGNGIMHERCAGVATCLGVNLNRKTIGVSKSLYCVDGLTKKGVSDGLETRLRDFLTWCEQQESHLKGKEFFVMCQNPVRAGYSYMQSKPQQKGDKIGSMPSLSELMKELSTYCSGFAVPLQGESGKIWGAALLGHGGSEFTKGVGTKVPIYISVGHNMCLQEAVQICVEVSQARIPEPVRQADLLGREWMRNKYSKP